MLKYRHIKRLFTENTDKIVSQDYATGTNYQIESGNDQQGHYFKITKDIGNTHDVTFYYSDGTIIQTVERE